MAVGIHFVIFKKKLYVAVDSIDYLGVVRGQNVCAPPKESAAANLSF